MPGEPQAPQGEQTELTEGVDDGSLDYLDDRSDTPSDVLASIDDVQRTIEVFTNREEELLSNADEVTTNADLYTATGAKYFGGWEARVIRDPKTESAGKYPNEPDMEYHFAARAPGNAFLQIRRFKEPTTTRVDRTSVEDVQAEIVVQTGPPQHGGKDIRVFITSGEPVAFSRGYDSDMRPTPNATKNDTDIHDGSAGRTPVSKAEIDLVADTIDSFADNKDQFRGPAERLTAAVERYKERLAEYEQRKTTPDALVGEGYDVNMLRVIVGSIVEDTRRNHPELVTAEIDGLFPEEVTNKGDSAEPKPYGYWWDDDTQAAATLINELDLPTDDSGDGSSYHSDVNQPESNPTSGEEPTK